MSLLSRICIVLLPLLLPLSAVAQAPPVVVTPGTNLTGVVTSKGNVTLFAPMTANAFLTGNGTGLPHQVPITGLVLGNGASAPTAYGGTGGFAHLWLSGLDSNGGGIFGQVSVSDLNAIAAKTVLGNATGSLGAPAALTTLPTGLTIPGLTGLGIRDTSAAFDVTLAGTSSTALTAGRTLTLDMVNGARTLKLGANLTLASDPGAVGGVVKSNGAGSFVQGACADLTNATTACSTAIGTSGGTIPLLNGVNTWSGAQTFGGVISSATVSTGGYAIGSLPAAGIAGRRAYVTDQLTTCAVVGAGLTAGGSIKCPVFDNGSAWVGG